MNSVQAAMVIQSNCLDTCGSEGCRRGSIGVYWSGIELGRVVA